MSTPRLRAIAFISSAIGLIALFLSFWFWIGGGFVTEKRNKVVVPHGFEGWVCISYGVQGAAPLAVDDDGYQVVDVPSTGIVKTVTKGKPGPLRDVYFIASPGRPLEKMAASYIGGGGTYANPGSPDGVFATYVWISPDPAVDYKRMGEPSSESLRGRCF